MVKKLAKRPSKPRKETRPKPKKRLTKEQKKRSEAAKRGAATRKKNAERKLKAEQRLKKSQAAKKGWETRKARGWTPKPKNTYEPKLQTVIDYYESKLKERDRLIAELQRKKYIEDNAPTIKIGHQKELVKYKGSKGYGLQSKVQSIYLDYHIIYDNQRELYELYEEGVQ